MNLKIRHISTKRKLKRPYATRKPKGYEVVYPGDLVEIDTLDPSRGNPQIVYSKGYNLEMGCYRGTKQRYCKNCRGVPLYPSG